MSNISQLLKQASGLEKQAYEKYASTFMGSTIASLVRGGVGFNQASSMVKRACEVQPQLLGLKNNFLAFEKAAEYVETLELKIEELEKVAEEVYKQRPGKDSEPIHKLAGFGFTTEELDMMSQLPENLLTKVASNTAQPYSMGQGDGISREKTDPLLEFILG